MKVPKAANGLFIFPIKAQFKQTTRAFNALVDTGSNICASSYRIITTLRSRPTIYKKILVPSAEPIRALGYSLTIGFDSKSIMTHVYRLPMENLPGIDFILGNPVLSQCKITLEKDCMDIVWN